MRRDTRRRWMEIERVQIGFCCCCCGGRDFYGVGKEKEIKEGKGDWVGGLFLISLKLLFLDSSFEFKFVLIFGR